MSRAAIVALTSRLGPMSAKQIAIELGIRDSTARTNIRRARAHGTKHLRVARWAGGVALYGPGPDPDAEGGSTADRIMEMMIGGDPATAAKIARALGLSSSVADSAIRRLRKKSGMLHIIGWVRRVGEVGGREAAIFKSGPGRDAPRPDFSNSQAEADQRRKAKRRIQRVMSGGRTRSKIDRNAPGPSAGVFDGLA